MVILTNFLSTVTERMWVFKLIVWLLNFCFFIELYGPRSRKTLSPPLSSYLPHWNKKNHSPIVILIILRSTVTELMCGF